VAVTRSSKRLEYALKSQPCSAQQCLFYARFLSSPGLPQPSSQLLATCTFRPSISCGHSFQPVLKSAEREQTLLRFSASSSAPKCHCQHHRRVCVHRSHALVRSGCRGCHVAKQPSIHIPVPHSRFGTMYCRHSGYTCAIAHWFSGSLLYLCCCCFTWALARLSTVEGQPQRASVLNPTHNSACVVRHL
jgi:hypothetical protein